MKKNLWVAFLLAFFCSAANADTIATWNFEVNTPADSTDSSTIGGINADVGSGVASGFHASTLTDWTTPSGNGSANSLSSNQWAVGDYYQFQFSSLNLSGITLEFDQARSSTGPGGFKVQWSTDGSSFIDLLGGSYSVLVSGSTGPATWSSSAARNPLYTYNFDLSSVSQLNNASSAFIRLTSTTSGAATGSNRIDNVTISGVPEPTSAGLLALTGVVGLAFRRRRS